jgi:hypothetical protein
MRFLWRLMAVDAERVAEEVLRLVVGYGETVVAFVGNSPVRLDYWACGMWSAGGAVGDVAVGLWLRYTLDRYLDREVAKAVASTDVYRAVEETCRETGVDGCPDVRYEELNFKPVELRLRGVYNGRAVYELNPFRCNIKVLAVRVFAPIWSLCPREERETCRRRAELTEKLLDRGVPVTDATRGIYVPVDASELVDFIKRVL